MRYFIVSFFIIFCFFLDAKKSSNKMKSKFSAKELALIAHFSRLGYKERGVAYMVFKENIIEYNNVLKGHKREDSKNPQKVLYKAEKLGNIWQEIDRSRKILCAELDFKELEQKIVKMCNSIHSVQNEVLARQVYWLTEISLILISSHQESNTENFKNIHTYLKNQSKRKKTKSELPPLKMPKVM